MKRGEYNLGTILSALKSPLNGYRKKLRYFLVGSIPTLLARWIIKRHYEKLSAILYNEHGKYISTERHDSPPHGYVWVKKHLRIKKGDGNGPIDRTDQHQNAVPGRSETV